MDRRSLSRPEPIARPLRIAGGLLLIAAVAALAYFGAVWRLKQLWAPDPEVIARSSLQAVRQQNELVPFAARFVSVVTAEEKRFGFSARKTLIMPGLVRYAVDMGALTMRDVRWDAATRTLAVRLPRPRIEGPEIDMTAIREYDGGGVLMALTDAERDLDSANRKAAQADLLAQAGQPLPMKLARDAARSAIERSFALPLKAAGLDATVTVRFADEG